MTVAPSPGRYVGTHGYVVVRVAPNDWRYEHRVLWERAFGPIPEGHHVHHVNHDRTDNRLENLRLVLGVEHNRAHTQARHDAGLLNNRGSKSGRWRHELDDAEIVRRRDAGESFRSIGRSMGATASVIANHYRRTLED
jgi:hypothetical protein